MVIDASGISVYGERFNIYGDDDALVGKLYESFDDLLLTTPRADANLVLRSEDGDIELFPDGGHDILPGNTGEDDLGNNTDYFDTIECVTLDDSHSPVRQVASPLQALRGMSTKRKHLTLEDADRIGLGKHVKAEITKHGGEMDVYDKDIDTFPEEILDFATEEDYMKGHKVYDKKLARYKDELKRGKNPKKPIWREPHTRVKVFDEMWLMIRAIQELADKVEEIDAKIH